MFVIKNYLFIFCAAILIIPFAPAKALGSLSLVDTGYDLCKINEKAHCSRNQNLLFRSSFPVVEEQLIDSKTLRDEIFSNLNKNSYQSEANFPKNRKDLDNYRIVLINLLYGENAQDNIQELNRLKIEFFDVTYKHNLPVQHKIYNLKNSFDKNVYAMMWWPITLTDNPWFNSYKPERLNSPQSNQKIQPMNFPYLINANNYDKNQVEKGKSLTELLQMNPKDKHPLLIVYHCNAGRDRTGAVTMAYFMKHGGFPSKLDADKVRSDPMSFQEALTNSTMGTDIANNRAKGLARTYCMFITGSGGNC